MKNFIIKFAPILIIFLFSLFFTKQLFYKDFIFSSEEKSLLNYDYANYRFKYIWNYSENFGAITPSYFAKITMGIFWRIAQLTGLSLVQTQRLFYFLIIFFTIFFAYKSFTYISNNSYVSLILSFAYVTVYNYYAFLDTTPKLLHYLIMPMSLFFWQRFFSTKKNIYLIAHFFFLVSLLSIGINPPQMVGAYSFIFVYLGLFYLSKKNLKYILMFLFPYLYNLGLVFAVNKLVFAYDNALSHFDPLKIAWTTISGRLYDILRLFGSWWDYASASDLPYNHLADFYHRQLGILVTYIPVVLVAYFIFKLSRSNPIIVRKVTSLLVVFILLVKGNTPPFNFIFQYLYSFNFFKIFREPWAKFIPDVNFSLLLALAYFSKIASSSKQKKAILLIMGAVLIFYCVPLVKANIIDHRNIQWKLVDTKIPEYWFDLYHWSQKNLTDKRVLILPQTTDKSPLTHQWKPYKFLQSPEIFFLYTHIIYQGNLSQDDAIAMSVFRRHLNPALLSLASIDYVLDQKDVEVPQTNYISLASVKTAIDFKNAIVFGKLQLYPVKKNFKSSIIRSTLIRGDSTTSCTKFEIPPVANNIGVKKINDVEYKIDLSNNLNGDLGILFASTFNKGWKIYRSTSIFAKPIIGEDHHVPAYCMFNFWDIPSKIAKSTTTFYIRYEPELLFDELKIAYIATGALYLFCIYFFRKRSV